MEKKVKPIVASHILAVSSIVRNNADVRNRIVLSLKEYYAKNENISPDDIRISLMVDRYIVIIDGLKREYYYKNKLFLNVFTDAFDNFTKHAAAVLDDFINIEFNQSNLPVGSEDK